MPSWDKDLINAVQDIQNNAFFDGDCTVLFYFGTSKDGERYVDAKIVKGHVFIRNTRVHKKLSEVVTTDDFSEALEALAKAHI